jgi:hypothetical protein
VPPGLGWVHDDLNHADVKPSSISLVGAPEVLKAIIAEFEQLRGQSAPRLGHDGVQPSRDVLRLHRAPLSTVTLDVAVRRDSTYSDMHRVTDRPYLLALVDASTPLCR